MNIIIDTHIFLWLIYDTKRVKKNHFDFIKNSHNDIYLSSISIAEMMIKKSLGNLDIEFDMFEMIEDMGVKILDFDGAAALTLDMLPYHHKDPFDRMIISQAKSSGYKIISDNRKFSMYDCELL